MTRLGSPGVSSQSVSGFSGRKGPKKHETDWDDTPGLPSPARQLSALPGPCPPVVRLPWALPASCPPSLGIARQLSAFPGPCPPKKQPENTPRKRHRKHKHLNWFVIPLHGQMAYDPHTCAICSRNKQLNVNARSKQVAANMPVLYVRLLHV